MHMPPLCDNEYSIGDFRGLRKTGKIAGRTKKQLPFESHFRPPFHFGIFFNILIVLFRLFRMGFFLLEAYSQLSESYIDNMSDSFWIPAAACSPPGAQ